VTANTKDGNEIFREEKIYMPQSPIYGRDNFMWSGGAYPGWKAGMVRDTSIQPEQTRTETFEIKYPYKDTEKDGKKIRTVSADEMQVNVKLWYMPTGGDPKQGVPGKTQFLFNEWTKSIKLKPMEDYAR
jgi:hypothetical protein